MPIEYVLVQVGEQFSCRKPRWPFLAWLQWISFAEIRKSGLKIVVVQGINNFFHLIFLAPHLQLRFKASFLSRVMSWKEENFFCRIITCWVAIGRNREPYGQLAR